MEELNRWLFALINGPAQPDVPVLALARFAAEWLIWGVAVGLTLAWLRGGWRTRFLLLDTGVVAVLALGMNFAIVALWYHPRPFELGIGHQLLPHAPDSSLPSDHATVLFAIAFGLVACGASRLWAGLALGVALLVAWARVWLGVHWPLDMVGSVLVALLATWMASGLMRSAVAVYVKQTSLRVADFVLDLLRVPENLAPRSGCSEPNPTGAASPRSQKFRRLP